MPTVHAYARDSLRFTILAVLTGACGAGSEATSATAATTSGAGGSTDTGAMVVTSGGAGETTGIATISTTGSGGPEGSTSGSSGSSSESSGTTSGAASGSSGAVSAEGSSGSSGGGAEGSSSGGDESGWGSTGELPAGPCADCPDPTMIMQKGEPQAPTGFVACSNGLIQRTNVVECLHPAPPDDCFDPDDPVNECGSAADCTDKPFGGCRSSFGCGFTLDGCGCVYGCASDEDCEAGEVCVCAGVDYTDWGRCVPSDCTSDADCDGGACAASKALYEDKVVQLACHTEGDVCCNDADCGDGFLQCTFDISVEMQWSCEGTGQCGRPLKIAGVDAVAGEAERSDWRAALALVQVPEAGVCAALAEHWSRVARAEHASVGSFARFILQLLAVGAPAELVVAAQRALADEVEHARVCFALAGVYGGRDVGPGALPAACGATVGALDEVVAAVIEEACVGETLAALEVAEAAMRAEDPVVRGLLVKIAADEGRHAALGWRFVHWALARGASRAEVMERFALAIAAAEVQARGATEVASLRRHGVVDPGLRAALVREGLAAVVRPCVAALLPVAA